MALSAQSMAHSSWPRTPSLAPAGRGQALAPVSSAASSWSGVQTDSGTQRHSSGPRTAQAPSYTSTPSISSLSYPPPFVVLELDNLPDPLSLNFTGGLSCRMVTFVGALPDDGLDSQARVLQFIVDSVRAKGFTSSYYFGDKSLDELRAILQRDRALSDAVRSLYGPDYAEAGISLVLMIRHVCRRPASNASRKGVQFAQDTEMIEEDDELGTHDASPSAGSLPAFPPFVVDDLLHLPDPFDPKVMTQLALLVYQSARQLSGDADDHVHLAQFLLDSMHYLKLVPTTPVSSIDGAALNACVRQDTAFSESLRGLLNDAIPPFVDRLFPIIRYVWYSLLPETMKPSVNL